MIKINFVKRHESAQLPFYSTKEAAGADIYSVEQHTIKPMQNVLVDTGLDCAIPEGFELQVRPRSGMAFKNKVTVLNAPGTIDSDYAGPLKVNLMNFSDVDYVIASGDRIAQIVVAPVTRGKFYWVSETRETERGAGGHGSTGTN